MRILMLNWKDHRHSLAGGAEVVTQEYLKHLVAIGHEVYLLSSHEKSLPYEETIDGVRIIRRGSVLTVRIWAVYLYITKLKNHIDIVVDQIHGLPFFTPLYSSQPVVALIHEIAGEIWFAEYPRLVALIGYLVERIYFIIYRKIPFITDAISTKSELVSYGIKAKNITVIPLTLRRTAPRAAYKSKQPLLVFIGRISPMKRVHLMLEAINILKYSIPHIKAVIAGYNSKPAYYTYLYKLINQMNLHRQVELQGQLTTNQKYDLFKRAWIHIHPSLKEGFGLTVLEAASQATPTICFLVHGLRDIVVHNNTGLVVSKATSADLAAAIEKLVTQPRLRLRLGSNAFKWYTKLPTWTSQTQKLAQVLRLTYSRFK